MFRRSTRRAPRPHRPAKLPLRLERLEDRTVPTQFLWIDTGNGNWNNPGNWQRVPNTGPEGVGYPNTFADSALLGDAIVANSTITIPDGVTITVGSITIDDNNNYTIAAAGTGQLRLYNSTSLNAVLLVGNSSGNGSHTISAPITMVFNLEATVPSNAVLTISGPISTAVGGGLGMTGPGTLRLGGSADNTYTGATTVRSGTLELNKTGGANAFGGNLVVGDGIGGTLSAIVRNLQDDNVPDGSTVTVNGDGWYQLNGNTERFGPLAVTAGRVDAGLGKVSFSALTMTGGSMTTTSTGFIAGVIELLGNATINASDSGATMSGTGELWLGFGSPHTFTVANSLQVANDLNISLPVRASVSPGLASLTKDGPGTMRLGGTGTFIGNATLNAGQLLIGNDTALGTGTFVINGGMILADGAARTLANSVTIAGDFTVGGGSEALTFTGAASLTGDRTITVASNLTTFAGLIAGGGLTKAGLGNLRFSGAAANTYTGLTKVVEGTLFLSKMAGVAAFAGNLEVGDDVGGPGTALVYHSFGSSNNIPDTATVTVRTDGWYDLSNQTESFSSLVVNGGTTIAGAGTLIISAVSMIGGRLNAGTGGQIQLNGNVTATSSAAGPAIIVGAGHVQMGNSARTFTVADGPAATDLAISSEIRGTAGLSKAGPGTMRLEGTPSNTYIGPTTVSAGTMELNKTGASIVAVPGDLTISGGVVREVGNNQIADTAAVNVNAGGTFHLNGQSDTVGPVTVTGGTLTTGGTAAGRLTAGNTSFNAAATLAMNLAGATTSDRITANGMVAVGGALQLSLATTVPLGTVITLIDNDGTDAVAGTFTGLPEGSLVVVGGQTFSISYAGGTGNDVALTRVNPPQVASFRVNDGSAQRSMVTSLTVTFSSQVTLGAGAFTLVPQGGGTPVALSFTTAVVNGVTVATIAFPGATGGSLADGRYVLTTVAAQVRDLAGIPMAADRQDTLFRLFGDINGDAAVNGLDLAVFRNAFGTTDGNPNFLSYLDQNGDGSVNGLDLGAFRTRFGTTLP